MSSKDKRQGRRRGDVITFETWAVLVCACVRWRVIACAHESFPVCVYVDVCMAGRLTVWQWTLSQKAAATLGWTAESHCEFLHFVMFVLYSFLPFSLLSLLSFLCLHPFLPFSCIPSLYPSFIHFFPLSFHPSFIHAVDPSFVLFLLIFSLLSFSLFFLSLLPSFFFPTTLKLVLPSIPYLFSYFFLSLPVPILPYLFLYSLLPYLVLLSFLNSSS